MQLIDASDPAAVALVRAIRSGDVGFLAENAGLARVGVRDSEGMVRTSLHLATDFPGKFPRGAEVVAALVAGGADVNARFAGAHAETPLHWAASCDDVAALDALLDAGADIEAPGSVLGGGPPLKNAVGFRQWAAAGRLVERGAAVDLEDAAALGMVERVGELLVGAGQSELGAALWFACHGGRGAVARVLVERGADVGWVAPWDGSTPVDAAAGSEELVGWLRGRG
ncbi:ankyrin repeat domain-containing protein [Actinokineospora guangxiensis]|uniref:Ankyrin repeat domain-containing protein n=1 Tax=Actinokineospora guangxiensis TaxID=1490288 RepID=A0ABW0EVG8_9PSEU